MAYSKYRKRYSKKSTGIPGIPSSFNCLMSNRVYHKKPKWVDKYKKKDNAMIDRFYGKTGDGYYRSHY